MPASATIRDVFFVRLSRNGRSRAINVAPAILQTLGWTSGTTLELWVEGGRLVVATAVANRHLLPAPGADSPAGGGTAGKDSQ